MKRLLKTKIKILSYKILTSIFLLNFIIRAGISLGSENSGCISPMNFIDMSYYFKISDSDQETVKNKVIDINQERIKIADYLAKVPQFLLSNSLPTIKDIQTHAYFKNIHCSSWDKEVFEQMGEPEVYFNIKYFVESLNKFPKGDFYFIGSAQYPIYVIAKAMASDSEYFNSIHFLPISRNLIDECHNKEKLIHFLKKEIKINKDRRYIYLIDTISPGSKDTIPQKNNHSLLQLSIIISYGIADIDQYVIPIGIPEGGFNELSRVDVKDYAMDDINQLIERLKINKKKKDPKHSTIPLKQIFKSVPQYPFYLQKSNWLEFYKSGMGIAYIYPRWWTPTPYKGCHGSSATPEYKKYIKFSRFDEKLRAIPELIRLDELKDEGNLKKIEDLVRYRKYFFNQIKYHFEESSRIKKCEFMDNEESNIFFNLSLDYSKTPKDVLNILDCANNTSGDNFPPNKITFKRILKTQSDFDYISSNFMKEKEALLLAENINRLKDLKEIEFKDFSIRNGELDVNYFNSLFDVLVNFEIEKVTINRCKLFQFDFKKGFKEFLNGIKHFEFKYRSYEEKSYYYMSKTIKKLLCYLVKASHIDLKLYGTYNINIKNTFENLKDIFFNNKDLRYLHLQLCDSVYFYENVFTLLTRNKFIEDMTIKFSKRTMKSTRSEIDSPDVFAFYQDDTLVKNNSLRKLKVDLYDSNLTIKHEEEFIKILKVLGLERFTNLESLEIKFKLEYKPSESNISGLISNIEQIPLGIQNIKYTIDNDKLRVSRSSETIN